MYSRNVFLELGLSSGLRCTLTKVRKHKSRQSHFRRVLRLLGSESGWSEKAFFRMFIQITVLSPERRAIDVNLVPGLLGCHKCSREHRGLCSYMAQYIIG